MFYKIIFFFITILSIGYVKAEGPIDCKLVVDRIRILEKQENYCTKDSECLVLKWPRDSYDCQRFANKKIDQSEYHSLLTNNSVRCGFPLYECKPISNQSKCDRGVCISNSSPPSMFSREIAFSLLKKEKNILIPIEKFNANQNMKDGSWSFVENKNRLSLPVYIVYPSRKVKVLKGR